MIRFATLALLALPALPAQWAFNVDLNPRATYVWGQYGGDALFALYPTSHTPWVVKTYPLWIRPGTIEVSFQPLAFAIWEPDACAVGAELRFDGTNLWNTNSVISTVPHTGWSFHPGLSRLDPWYAFQNGQSQGNAEEWFVSYLVGGGFPFSTSSCIPTVGVPWWEQDKFPDYVVMALAVRFH